MSLKRRQKISPSFSMSSMTDLIFLLLIFFMITSTLISPNAVKLLLPESNSKTMAKQNVTVYIDESYNFYVGEQPVGVADLEPMIAAGIEAGITDACVVLRADKTVPVQYVVNVIDAVNNINTQSGSKHKVIMATSPKSE